MALGTIAGSVQWAHGAAADWTKKDRLRLKDKEAATVARALAPSVNRAAAWLAAWIERTVGLNVAGFSEEGQLIALALATVYYPMIRDIALAPDAAPGRAGNANPPPKEPEIVRPQFAFNVPRRDA